MYRTIELENQSAVVDTMHLIFDPSDDDSLLIESDDDKPRLTMVMFQKM